MNYGICLQSYIPQRAEAKESSEMVNQLLLGENYLVEENLGKWLKIKSLSDNYTGYIDAKCHTDLSFQQHSEWEGSNKIIVNHFTETEVNGSKHWLSPGSILPFEGILWFEHNYSPKLNCNLETVAKSYLNAPYLWGGKSALGIDCSGFTQAIFRTTGIYLPRDAYQQAELGEKCEEKEGALAFFENSDGKITHVGLVLSNSNIIHASGKVRIDTLKADGIYLTETGKRSHKLSFFKCIE